jgi:hypothetical protein
MIALLLRPPGYPPQAWFGHLFSFSILDFLFSRPRRMVLDFQV